MSTMRKQMKSADISMRLVLYWPLIVDSNSFFRMTGIDTGAIYIVYLSERHWFLIKSVSLALKVLKAPLSK